jgi:hypothetical protein
VAAGSNQPTGIKRLVVMPGIQKPDATQDTAPAGAAEGSVVVALANGDYVAADSALLSEGRLTLKTPQGGEMTREVDQVREIRFVHKAAKPEKPPKFARIAAAECRLTFDSCEIFEDRVVGHSARYGEAPISRTSLDWIQFRHLGTPASAPAAPSGRIETVFTSLGERLKVAVLGTIEGKWLRLQGAEFKETIAIELSTITRIEEKNKPAAAKGMRITMTNGDYIIGSLNAITSEKADVVTASGAAISLPLSRLAHVMVEDPEGAGIIESKFDKDEMAPWKRIRGFWIFENDCVWLAGGAGNPEGGEALLAAPYERKGACTFVADVEIPASAREKSYNFEMVLFASRIEDPEAMGGLILNFRGKSYEITLAQPGRRFDAAQVAQQGLDQPVEGHVRVRMAYNPATMEGRVWINDAGDGYPFKTEGVTQGTHVAIGSYQVISVRRLTVMPGIQKPGDPLEAFAEGTVVVELVNDDLVTAESVLLSAGHLTLKTAFGEIKSDVDRVREISIVHKSIKPQAAAKFVRVEAGECVLTLDSCEIFEDRVIGHSAQYGAVSLNRNSIEWIQFQRGPE